MGIYGTKSSWQRLIQPVVDFCVARRIHPDAFIYAAIGLSILVAAAFSLARANPLWLALVPPSVLIRLFLNLMDGQVARGMGLADAWGEVKNEFGDRIADAVILLGLGLSGYVDLRWALVLVTLVMGISYLGILGKAIGGARVYGGVFGKGDRMIALALFSFYPMLSGNLASYDYYLIAGSLAALVTLLQRLGRIYRNAKSI